MKINKRSCASAVLLVALILAGVFAYGRYVRPRAYPYAAVVVSAPSSKTAAMSGIVPIKEPIGLGLNFTINLDNFTFREPGHELAVKWVYLGGIFQRDFYKFTMTFDGVTHTKIASTSEEPVELLSQKGYGLRLIPRDLELYGVAK
ncbi:hypothetical protein Pan258_42890 [Symmachiella dynata]|uniref:hypothetical protein n=1 Tax=Symmachiella dynata TaxID=2527995 RepID=UPI001187DF7F|nr:hypothetical protein [Symmachiella dynata]QDT50232.1 hypothetical protein Pan258_42890 [Symmachiella dynata]